MGRGKEFNSGVELLFDWFLQAHIQNEETTLIEEILRTEIKYKRKIERERELKNWVKENKHLSNMDNVSLLLKDLMKIG